MTDSFAKLSNHLTEKQIGHWSNAQDKAVCFDLPALVGFYRIYLRIDDESGQLQACGQCRLCPPQGSRAAVTQFLQLAAGQSGGAVEFDEAASELRFRLAERLSDDDDAFGDLIDRLIHAARKGVDAHLRALLSVIFGNDDPADAHRRLINEAAD